VKAGTAAALVTDHERKAVAARVPYFHVLDGTNDAHELHGHSTAYPQRSGPARGELRTTRAGSDHSSLAREADRIRT
jgi:hypothetical protein